MFNKFFDSAISKVRRHDHKDGVKLIDREFRFMGAIIVKGGRTLSVGFNRYDRVYSPFQEAVKKKVKREAFSIHAEVDAILKIKNKDDLVGANIYVVRRLAWDKPNHPMIAMARPCPICYEILKGMGFARAYYTIANHEFGTINFRQQGQNELS